MKNVLYMFVITLIGRLVILAGNLRDSGHGHAPYMQNRVLNGIDSVTKWLAAHRDPELRGRPWNGGNIFLH